MKYICGEIMYGKLKLTSACGNCCRQDINLLLLDINHKDHLLKFTFLIHK